MKLIFAILLIVVASKEVLADECNEDNMKICLYTLQDIVLNQMNGMKNAETNLNSYCRSVAHEGQCVADITKDCEASYPKISILLSTFNDYLNQFCGENAKIYMDIVRCFKDHKPEFEKCWSHKKSKRDVDHLKNICMEVDSMNCLAKLSKKKCKDGEAFENALEKRVKTLKSDVCISGACYLANSFWTIAITVLALFLIRSKL